MKKLLLILTSLILTNLSAQSVTDSIQKLEEVVIETNRISLPLSSLSQTLSLMDSVQMAALPVKSVEELLQFVNGVDIRRSGIDGTHADVYIRGGNFDQVLILIDGVKTDDMQTGHHTMKVIIAPENIERIEVIKGAAARIYGVNAMNGAINIVTKKIKSDVTTLQVKAGYFETYGAGFHVQKVTETGDVMFQANGLKSAGYRYNSDFNNWNAFFKTDVNGYQVLATYQERDFGANGYYAVPTATEQYEETKTSLTSVKKLFQIKPNFSLNAQAYWRRNQDTYIYKRKDPDFYQNRHINTRVGVALNSFIKSSLGVTGLGIDLNEGFLSSNNLGKRDRFTGTLFAEHHFETLNGKLDINPGIAMTHYSDFGLFLFPGIDIGYRMHSQIKAYISTGYTSRVPTFTDLYYVGRNEMGNPDLKPEKAWNSEIGLTYQAKNIAASAVYFYRDGNQLIDWVMDNQLNKWQAQNYDNRITKGFEVSGKYFAKIGGYHQYLSVSYNFLDEKTAYVTRYAINSYKHQVSSVLHTQWLKYVSQNISHRFVERYNGQLYNVWDASMALDYKKWKIQAMFNNLFSEEYWETYQIEMPKFDASISISYSF